MQTDEFAKDLDRLIALAKKKRIAIMCAEAAPFMCHRSLIADALQVKGLEVIHISGKTGGSRHRRTPWARVRKGRITYP